MYKHNLQTLPRSSDFRKCNQLINLREEVLDLRPKALKMTVYVDWTCINVYRKDVHA